MAISNRAAIYNKIYRILKKHYKPVVPPVDWSVLQHTLYACCLENAQYDHADEAYSKVMQTYFDLNEIRVTTVGELSELMKGLPDPSAAAQRLRQILQNVFESCYSFDIDSLRKQNIGKAVKLLEKYQATPFVVSYVTQQGLAGHSIPKDAGVLQVLYIVGAITAAEGKQRNSPGLERTVSKKKGPEFFSLLHQLGADLSKTPHAPAVRAILLEIDPTAKERLPKRKIKKKAVKPPTKEETKKTTSTPTKKAGKKVVAKKAPAKKAPAKKAPAKKAPAKAAVVQFTRATAVDWAPEGITANAICPGMFMTEANLRWSKIHPEVVEHYRSQIPLGDFGHSEDLGPLAVFLASEAARYMTGASLVLDGGFTLC